ncbi:MAG: argininosuccinate lyase, partial [Actinobacteria bacterium]|nr:argininosuccinate lyase [Actinomycetota bacterium]
MGDKKSSDSLWHGRFAGGPAESLMAYTVSLPFDRRLWDVDIQGSKAHVRGLGRAGVLSPDEVESVLNALEVVHQEFSDGAFEFRDGDEDIHTAVERRVTEI